mgnify:CR=1 FL=1
MIRLDRMTRKQLSICEHLVFGWLVLGLIGWGAGLSYVFMMPMTPWLWIGGIHPDGAPVWLMIFSTCGVISVFGVCVVHPRLEHWIRVREDKPCA